MNKFLTALATAGVVSAVAAPSLAATKTVKVDDDFFSPKTVTIKKGDTVKWTWVGDNAHDVRFKGFKSKTQVNGTYKHKFRKKGTFKYVCIIHSGMTGKVVVR